MAEAVDIFTDIYAANRWNGEESRSGPGSGTAATLRLGKWLRGLISEYDIRSLLDVGCGDNWWMPDVPGYVGIDLVPEAVLRARTMRPDRDIRMGDGRYSLPRGFDAVFCRDVMQHLSFVDAVDMLHQIMAVQARYVILSTYSTGTNEDIQTGGNARPDLTVAPFHMPEPLRWMQDGWDWKNPDRVRDPQKWMAVWAG